MSKHITCQVALNAIQENEAAHGYSERWQPGALLARCTRTAGLQRRKVTESRVWERWGLSLLVAGVVVVKAQGSSRPVGEGKGGDMVSGQSWTRRMWGDVTSAVASVGQWKASDFILSDWEQEPVDNFSLEAPWPIGIFKSVPLAAMCRRAIEEQGRDEEGYTVSVIAEGQVMWAGSVWDIPGWEDIASDAVSPRAGVDWEERENGVLGTLTFRH